MKLFKRILAITVSIVIVVVISEIDFSQIFGEWKSKAVREAEAIPKIGFSEEALADEKPVIFTEEELMDEDITADDFRGSNHFSRLSDEKKLVYHALEYALENGYLYVYFDEKLISSSGVLSDVLERLALDSPLLEQNLSYQTGEFTTYYDVKNSSAELSGYYIRVENFDSRHWDKKMIAVNSAKSLIDKLPEGMSEVETAKYIHQLMLDKIEYYDYSDKKGEVSDYIYDAIINGKTHCDGSANAYSLLLNLAGIECMEKQYTGEDTVGHTWNFARLDGVWYNIDATAVEDKESSDYKYRVRKLFAFSDRAEQYTPDYATAYPEAKTDLGMKINAELEKITESDFVKRVRAAYKENKEDYACFIVYNFDERSAQKAMKRLANDLDRSVYWILYEGKDETTKHKAILVVFSE